MIFVVFFIFSVLGDWELISNNACFNTRHDWLSTSIEITRPGHINGIKAAFKSCEYKDINNTVYDCSHAIDDSLTFNGDSKIYFVKGSNSNGTRYYDMTYFEEDTIWYSRDQVNLMYNINNGDVFTLQHNGVYLSQENKIKHHEVNVCGQVFVLHYEKEKYSKLKQHEYEAVIMGIIVVILCCIMFIIALMYKRVRYSIVDEMDLERVNYDSTKSSKEDGVVGVQLKEVIKDLETDEVSMMAKAIMMKENQDGQ